MRMSCALGSGKVLHFLRHLERLINTHTGQVKSGKTTCPVTRLIRHWGTGATNASTNLTGRLRFVPKHDPACYVDVRKSARVDISIPARAVQYFYVRQALEKRTRNSEFSWDSLLAATIDVPFTGFDVADDRSPIRKTFGVVELRPYYERPRAVNVAE